MGVVRELITRLGFKVDKKDFEKLDNAIDRAKGKLQSLRKGFLIAGAAGATAFGGAFLKNLAATNAEFESLQTRLEQLVGPEKAVSTFKELQAFAAETPFQLNEIVAGFLKLKGAGFDVGVEELRTLGDVAAVSNKPFGELVQAISSSARGLTSMVDNFQEAGIAGKSLGKKIELLNSSLKTTARIDPKDRKALLGFFLDAGRNKKVAGSTKRLSRTIGGLFSTLKDNVSQFLFQIGKSGFNVALREFLQELTKTFQGTEAGSLAKSLGQGLGKALNFLTKALIFLRNNARKLKPFLLGLFGFLASAKLAFSLKAVGVALGPLLTFLLGLAKGGGALALIKGLGLAFLKAAAPIVLVTGALFTLFLVLEDLHRFFTGGKSAVGRFIEKWQEAPGPMGETARGLRDILHFGRRLAVELVAKLQGMEPVLSRLTKSTGKLLGALLRLGGVSMADTQGNISRLALLMSFLAGVVDGLLTNMEQQLTFLVFVLDTTTERIEDLIGLMNELVTLSREFLGDNVTGVLAALVPGGSLALATQQARPQNAVQGTIGAAIRGSQFQPQGVSVNNPSYVMNFQNPPGDPSAVGRAVRGSSSQTGRDIAKEATRNFGGGR